MTEKITESINRKRAALQKLQAYDPAAVEELRRKIIGEEALLREVKHLQGQVESAGPARALFESELELYAKRREKILHRTALALGVGGTTRLKLDELDQWFLSPELIAEVRASIETHLVEEPMKRLAEIEDLLNSKP